MAILQASLADETLSRQERAVIRGIYRAGQLNEAYTMLMKVAESAKSYYAASSDNASMTLTNNAPAIAMYLQHQIAVALESTKVPATPALKPSSMQESQVT